MKFYNINHLRKLYIFFLFLSLSLFFFSTAKVEAKAFDINDVEISQPFANNFDKNNVIDQGFRQAFFKLLSLIVTSSDQEKIENIRLNEIKVMIESFSIKEEKFINDIYYVNLGVSFNKKKIFKYLEERNIFPSSPKKEKFLFIPIIIDETRKDLLVFSNNNFFDNWNVLNESHHLIEYILPTEDLEDLKQIKSNYETIEKYNFEEIIKKYYLDNSIIALFFKNKQNVRVLSKISIKNNLKLKNQTFKNIDINDQKQLQKIVDELKIIYEDNWKISNQINTSIKLLLTIKTNSSDEKKISKFENILRQNNLIYDFYISKFSNDTIFYKIVFNGTPDIFLRSMGKHRFSFNTQNKIWIMK